MKTQNKLLQELLEKHEWGFNYHSKKHEAAKALYNATCENEDLKEINEQAEKDLKYHYDGMIKDMKYVEVLKAVM